MDMQHKKKAAQMAEEKTECRTMHNVPEEKKEKKKDRTPR